MGLSYGFDPGVSPFLRPSWLRAFGQPVKPEGAQAASGSEAPASAAPRLTLVKATDVETTASEPSRDESSR